MVTKDFRIAWSHRQDAKASPNSSFSANVNFATSSYDQRNLSSLYNPQQYSNNTKTSSVSYSRNFPRDRIEFVQYIQYFSEYAGLFYQRDVAGLEYFIEPYLSVQA